MAISCTAENICFLRKFAKQPAFFNQQVSKDVKSFSQTEFCAISALNIFKYLESE